MKSTILSLLTIASAEEGFCNIRECGCPPYREPWCVLFVFVLVCSECSAGFRSIVCSSSVPDCSSVLFLVYSFFFHRCTPRNSFVFSPVCQISKGFCDYTCGEVWCGKPKPAPPTPPPPKLHMYHIGNASDIHCYQTNYTDPFYKSLGYIDGFCPFQLVDSVDTYEVCKGHSNENTKYCPNDLLNISVFKMGKS